MTSSYASGMTTTTTTTTTAKSTLSSLDGQQQQQLVDTKNNSTNRRIRKDEGDGDISDNNVSGFQWLTLTPSWNGRGSNDDDDDDVDDGRNSPLMSHSDHQPYDRHRRRRRGYGQQQQQQQQQHHEPQRRRSSGTSSSSSVDNNYIDQQQQQRNSYSFFGSDPRGTLSTNNSFDSNHSNDWLGNRSDHGSSYTSHRNSGNNNNISSSSKRNNTLRRSGSSPDFAASDTAVTTTSYHSSAKRPLGIVRQRFRQQSSGGSTTSSSGDSTNGMISGSSTTGGGGGIGIGGGVGLYELKNAKDALMGSISAIINFLGTSGVSKPSIEELKRNLDMGRYFATLKRAQDYVRCVPTKNDDEMLAMVHLSVTAWEALCEYKGMEYRRAYDISFALRFGGLADPQQQQDFGGSGSSTATIGVAKGSKLEIKKAIDAQVTIAEQVTLCQKKLYLVNRWKKRVLQKTNKASTIEPQGYQAIPLL